MTMPSSRSCYLVNDRPVVIVTLPNGGADCMVLDLRSGNFVVDRRWLSRTLPGDMKDVDALTPEQMDDVVAAHRARIVRRLADGVAGMSSGDRRPLMEVLGIDPAQPPLGSARVEIGEWGALHIVHPALVRRHELEDALGPGVITPEPQDTVSFRVAGPDPNAWCRVDARFPAGVADADSIVVSRGSPAAVMPSG